MEGHALSFLCEVGFAARGRFSPGPVAVSRRGGTLFRGRTADKAVKMSLVIVAPPPRGSAANMWPIKLVPSPGDRFAQTAFRSPNVALHDLDQVLHRLDPLS